MRKSAAYNSIWAASYDRRRSDIQRPHQTSAHRAIRLVLGPAYRPNHSCTHFVSRELTGIGMGADNSEHYNMDEEDFDRWIARARSDDLSDNEIAVLAETLAATGECWERMERSADLASTGGPGSLSTLWTPAVLAASGYTVPKLGVPGRPAGGVDALAQIPGYRVNLNPLEAKAVLDDCGYVHFLAGNHFAPADAAMFAYRQRVGAQAIPTLAMASLLAKKLAMGVRLVGLEVRAAPHGNFGRDGTAARENARRFCNVADRLKLHPICVVTDGNRPQQPYIGRGEAVLALARLLKGEGCSWLAEHASACRAWTSALIASPAAARSDAADSFFANIKAQGGSVEGFHAKASAVDAAHTRYIEAPREGIIEYDLRALREAILASRLPDEGAVFDDSIGLILLVRPGTLVKSGEPLISVRCNDKRWPTLKRDLADVIKLASGGQDDTTVKFNEILEIIGVGDR